MIAIYTPESSCPHLILANGKCIKYSAALDSSVDTFLFIIGILLPPTAKDQLPTVYMNIFKKNIYIDFIYYLITSVFN